MCLLCADKGEGERGRVLIIDDEPSVADALRVILEDEGFSVAVAANGRDGIAEARRTHSLFEKSSLRRSGMFIA